jgi:hypothetical protein
MLHTQGEAKKVQYTSNESALGQNARALVINGSRLLVTTTLHAVRLSLKHHRSYLITDVLHFTLKHSSYNMTTN